jgi:hypothetical protein
MPARKAEESSRDCSASDLEDRLPADSATLAPEDILLTKLQIFEVNDKDLIDTMALAPQPPRRIRRPARHQPRTSGRRSRH